MHCSPPHFDMQQRQAYHTDACPGQRRVTSAWWYRKREWPTWQAVGRQEESTLRRSIVGIILVLALGCLVAPRRAEAQQPVKVHRIGVLMFSLIFFIEELQQDCAS